MKPAAKGSMVVAGVMSGTSADGIDVALVRIGLTGGKTRIKLLAHYEVKYPAVLRRAVLAAMDAKQTSTAELARLNWRLGIAYAEAVRAAVEKHRVKVDLVGCHGQTVYHQAKPTAYAGRQVACTWQLGEPALIAAEMRVPVVSNFRPADMAVGGQGAPLVPLLDYALFAHPERMRVLQNIGGIGNLTAIPNSDASKLMAFDTGPGNMVIDAVMDRLFAKPYDRDGRVAARGRVLQEVVKGFLREKYFAKQPPKSAGREQFGADFAEEFLARCKKTGGGSEDVVATATALTVESIALAYERFVNPLNGKGGIVDYVVSGGGARNVTLMEMLRARLDPVGCRIVVSDQMGLPSQAKEAVAFALLAWQTWHRRPGNVPAATGASRAVVLGEICYG